MTQFLATRLIDAPIELVFRTVADISNFSRAVPHIQNVEFLSEIKVGVGTRFRETRSMNGKEHETELEVTEYVVDEHVRMVSDTNGTVWDSIFSVKRNGGQTELTLAMDGRAHRLLSKIVNPMIKGMIGKALEKDMDAVKTYCETEGRR